MEKFEKILLKHKCAKRTTPPKIGIKDIEKAAGFSLPEDYKKFLLGFKAFEGPVGEEYFSLLPIEKLIKNNKDYTIFENLPDTLAIGSNMGGEFIAIEKVKKKIRIVISPYIDLDKKCHIEIGSSFTDFLVKTDEGKEWFE
ncbi:MAG: hypothetical protein K0S32_4043 [Bacteroidetes bacterium]|jgi:hypothetical protein|nr:hypothetical protein [Bacteroidota bacterium]